MTHPSLSEALKHSGPADSQLIRWKLDMATYKSKTPAMWQTPQSILSHFQLQPSRRVLGYFEAPLALSALHLLLDLRRSKSLVWESHSLAAPGTLPGSP